VNDDDRGSFGGSSVPQIAMRPEGIGKFEKVQGRPSSRIQYVIVVTAVAIVAALNAMIAPLTGPRAPGLIFLLVVVLLALFVGRGPVFLAGALSALVWNFFFLPPHFTFAINSVEDTFLFGLYFVVSVVLGQLVARIRAQEQAEREREERATILYELTRQLAQAGTRDEVVRQITAGIAGVFHVSSAVLLPNSIGLAAHPDSSLVLNDDGLRVAEWAFRHRKATGRFVDNLAEAKASYLPLMTERAVLGVLAIGPFDQMIICGQYELLEEYARQAALVLDRVALRAAAEETKLLAESERLSNALLNSISHELRTPLAVITTAISALAEAGDDRAELRRLLLAEVEAASTRLNRLVGNLLDVSRLESGHVQAKADWCDVDDLIQTTVGSLEGQLSNHPLRFEIAANLPLARLDFTLMQQALSNLLLNVVTHTPSGTEILMGAEYKEQCLFLSVSDNGPGLAPGLLPRVFDKFARASNAPAGGTGLGLAIVKGFVEAQGGKITATSGSGGGVTFSIHLPQTEAAPQVEIIV
jgi:two-component system sensor histidine kinase KdpD